MKALLAARKEKQKEKEDASGTGIAIGSVDKEEETDSLEDENAISNVDKKEAFNFNISSTTKNKTTLLEEGDKIIAVTSIAETLKEQNKDENADAEEEDKEKNKGDVSEKVKGDKPCHPLLTPEGENYDWSPLSKPVISDYEKRKNETTPVSLDENQTGLGLTNATFISDKESEQPNKEIQSIEAIVPNVVSKKESESEKPSSTKGSEKGKDERRPPPFDLFVKVDPITQNQAFTEQHHQSPTISPILPSTKISDNSSENSESATETSKDFETFPKEFHGESENNTSEGLNEPATSDDQLNKVAPFPASTQSSERESTSAASDATLAAIKLNGPNITYTTSMGAATTNRPNTGTTLTKATVVNLATTNTNTKVNLTSTTTTIVAGLLDLLWGGQYGVNDVLLDDGTPSLTFVEPASSTNPTNDKENLKPGPDVLLPPSDLGSVDISPASGASDVEVAPNISAIDADAGLDTLALDGLAIHSTSSIVRPTDQLHDMQTTQDHPEENNEMGNNTFPTTLVPPTSASFDDKTTQAASLVSISVKLNSDASSASIPGGPTSIPGEAYLPLATAEDPNLEVVTAAAELFVTNPTSPATSTRETDLLSASGNSKYFDKSTPAFAGNLSKVPHSTSQTKEPEQNWVEMISLEEGKGEPDLLVVESSTSTISTLTTMLPTGAVESSTKQPEPEIHKQPTVEKAEKAESRPNGENGANSSSPFWVWPTSEDPWVWI